MSHFTVLVIGENVEEQLYPFWELDLNEEDLKADPRAEFCIEITQQELATKADKEITGAIEWRKGVYKDNPTPENATKLEAYQDFLANKDWAGFVDYYHGYNQDENGDYGYYHNPNAKWDWYQIGGRWCGYFTMKEGKVGVPSDRHWANETKDIPINKADQAFMRDIDWEAMKSERRTKAEVNWEKHKKKLTEQDDKYHPYFEFGIKQDDTRDQYLARYESFATFAVVKDGKWYEHGEMGWWACVSNEKDQDVWNAEFDKLVMSLPDDTLLTVVDCHI
jgi:hypothetical protein